MSEVGRASAISDVVEVAREMSTRAKALENSVIEALSEQLKRWRRAAIFLGAGLFIQTAMLVAVIVLLVFSIGVSTDNNTILNTVIAQQQDTHEVAQFVECLKQHPTEPDAQQCFGK